MDRRLALAGAIVVALALAGCGDAGDPVEPPVTPAPTPVAEVAPPAVAPPAEAAPPVQVTPVPVTPDVPEAPAPVAAPPPAEAPPAAAIVSEPAAPIVAADPTVAAPPVPAAEPAPAVAPPTTPELAWLQQPPFTNPAPRAAPAAATPSPTLEERLAMANAADGAIYLMQCEICHTVDQRGAAGIGPNLFGIVGAPVGRDPGFNYSPAFQSLAATEATWTPERLDAFLAAPGAEIPGTRMGFGGFDDPDTRANVIAWLATLVPAADEPPALPEIVGVQIPGLDPVAFVGVQADVGADQYVALGCGACHGADMRGGAASALAGPGFAERWFERPLSDLVAALRTMPPDAPATLSDTRYLELTAAILVANGFAPGAGPLRANPVTLEATGFYQLAPVLDRRNP
ncbi:MAG: hypothetical protein KIS68_05130 [Bauldia sp.]|nr:hypothetical protein [Bauldia sp.]